MMVRFGSACGEGFSEQRFERAGIHTGQQQSVADEMRAQLERLHELLWYGTYCAKRHEEHRVSGFLRLMVLGVARNPDDAKRASILRQIEPELFIQGIFMREESACEGLIDDRDERGFLVIPLIKRPSAKNWLAQCLEVAGADAIPCRIGVLGKFGSGVTSDVDELAPVIS